MNEDADGTPTNAGESMDPDEGTGPATPMGDDGADEGNSPADGDPTDGGLTAAVGPDTLGGWLAYVAAPVLVGTVAYWFVSDATALETVVFAAMMVGVVLAMDFFFDTIPE